MKNLWKSIYSNWESDKESDSTTTICQKLWFYDVTYMCLYYQGNINYRHKMVVTYQDIGFTIIAQP